MSQDNNFNINDIVYYTVLYQFTFISQVIRNLYFICLVIIMFYLLKPIKKKIKSILNPELNDTYSISSIWIL